MPASGSRAVSSAPASSRIDFAGSSRPTVGVEWEFALVDAETRDLSNEAAAVIAEIGENPHVHKELLRNTVEIVTGICENTGQAMDDLRVDARRPRARSCATAAWSCSAREHIRSRSGRRRS